MTDIEKANQRYHDAVEKSCADLHEKHGDKE